MSPGPSAGYNQEIQNQYRFDKMSVTTSIAGDGAGGRTVMAEVPVTLMPGASGVKEKQKAPQKRVDDFWRKFTTKAPGKGKCGPVGIAETVDHRLTWK